jgi:predicted AAA+ superfamily ATPase
MIRQDQLARIADSQKEDFITKTSFIPRECLMEITDLESFATLITGIRRCGKSTLLQQVIRLKYPDAFFLNFEDIRLAGFDVSDFSRLYNEIKRRSLSVVFLDEPQLADKWEIFVHQLLRENFRVYITGSNATLLSREMGTHLTGRNLPFELYPFSFNEFLNMKGLERSADSLHEYLT